MVATSIKHQQLSARDDSGDGINSDWGPLQIATPAIVGGVLLLLFAVYVIWQRRVPEKRSYDYYQVLSDWVTKMERMFVPRQKRQRVLHLSVPTTLDDSMRSSALAFDFGRRSRQSRSDSTDSQIPLTLTSYTFDYPPSQSSGLSPPIAKRRAVRWWWIFGSRPQQVKSEEPGQRWRIDGPDTSSSGHDHSSQGHRYTGTLSPLHEDVEDAEDEVIRIGENFTSVASTPMTQHFSDQARFIRGMPIVSEQQRSYDSHTPVPVVSAAGTPVSSADRSLPPSYDGSRNYSRYSSTEDIRQVSSDLLMAIPPPVRAAGYPSVFHGRALSSDSFLETQSPMVVASMY